MRSSYIEIAIYGEKNYRLFLDIIKKGLDSMKFADINAVQSFILMNINENTVTVGEVISRGYYIGSNVSYNIKKLIKNGYINQSQSSYDKRSVYLKVSQKGLKLCDELDNSMKKYMQVFETKMKGKFDVNGGINFLKMVESMWKDILSKNM
ncbi:MAG: winged helix DNA-binding protein [Holosporales bacterium]|nr:winged helix DNA-binding protein [Holosporales bacterium]